MAAGERHQQIQAGALQNATAVAFAEAIIKIDGAAMWPVEIQRRNHRGQFLAKLNAGNRAVRNRAGAG